MSAIELKVALILLGGACAAFVASWWQAAAR